MKFEIDRLVTKYPELSACVADIEETFQLLRETYRNEGQVLLCGNGGSAADCEHIVGELMKGFLLKRPVNDSIKKKLQEDFPNDGDYLADHLQGALPAISLVSQSSLISAFANDIAADMIYAQQVFGYGRPGDAVIGISTSGNSKNVIHALQVARAKGLKTIGLTGKNGGQMNSICDVTICVPLEETLDIQERHLPIYHTLCVMLEKEFFGQ
ncbi:D-sedoheptulose-7-phosphate isomerase [Lederbergia citrea]|uniref:D-sedoheptulose-7-phosphate isomerase n=1 Tax=Lederbergia citrea TaxID=2833581 RepID=UPI001BC9995A|nr:SIS domain-containing protein [Lederbergia citrea]MBS4205203.1 SIS domain-containing protein [Lederbergia citrea]